MEITRTLFRLPLEVPSKDRLLALQYQSSSHEFGMQGSINSKSDQAYSEKFWRIFLKRMQIHPSCL